MSPSEDVKFSNVRGLYLRKYGMYWISLVGLSISVCWKEKGPKCFHFFHYINPICLTFLIITIFWSECHGKNLLCKPVLLKEWGKVGHWCLLKRKSSEMFPNFFCLIFINPIDPSFLIKSIFDQSTMEEKVILKTYF